VGVRCNECFGGARQDLARHAEVDLQRELSISATSRAVEIEQQKFAEAAHRRNPAARQLPFDRCGIVDEIRFLQAHAEDAPSRKHLSQSAGDSFDFW